MTGFKNGYILYQGILLVHQQVPSMYNQQPLVETYLAIAHIALHTLHLINL